MWNSHRASAARNIGTCAALVLISLTMLSPAGALGLARVPGDFWTYDITMDIFGVNVTGNVTYAFEREDTVTINGSTVNVNVMSVDGSLAGKVTILIPVEVSATLRGESFETRQDWAVAELNETAYVNISTGSPPAQFVTHSTLVTLLQFSPSLFSGFHPSTASPGDSWTESVHASGDVTTRNGTSPPETQSVNSTLTFSVVISPSLEKVTTPAGTFDCLVLTATNTSGEKVVIWWSNLAANLVMAKVYQSGATTATATLSLKDYASKKTGISSTYLIAGIAIIVVALVVLGAVLMMRRRSKPPEPSSRPETSAPQERR